MSHGHIERRCSFGPISSALPASYAPCSALRGFVCLRSYFSHDVLPASGAQTLGDLHASPPDIGCKLGFRWCHDTDMFHSRVTLDGGASAARRALPKRVSRCWSLAWAATLDVSVALFIRSAGTGLDHGNTTVAWISVAPLLFVLGALP